MEMLLVVVYYVGVKACFCCRSWLGKSRICKHPLFLPEVPCYTWKIYKYLCCSGRINVVVLITMSHLWRQCFFCKDTIYTWNIWNKTHFTKILGICRNFTFSFDFLSWKKRKKKLCGCTQFSSCMARTWQHCETLLSPCICFHGGDYLLEQFFFSPKLQFFLNYVRSVCKCSHGKWAEPFPMRQHSCMPG